MCASLRGHCLRYITLPIVPGRDTTGSRREADGRSFPLDSEHPCLAAARGLGWPSPPERPDPPLSRAAPSTPAWPAEARPALVLHGLIADRSPRARYVGVRRPGGGREGRDISTKCHGTNGSLSPGVSYYLHHGVETDSRIPCEKGRTAAGRTGLPMFVQGMGKTDDRQTDEMDWDWALESADSGVIVPLLDRRGTSLRASSSSSWKSRPCLLFGAVSTVTTCFFSRPRASTRVVRRALRGLHGCEVCSHGSRIHAGNRPGARRSVTGAPQCLQ